MNDELLLQPQPLVQPLPHDSMAEQLTEIRGKLASLPPPNLPVPTGHRTAWGKLKSMRWLIFGIILIVIGPIITWIMFVNPQAGRSVFILSPIRITGPVSLCPGETLNFEFDVMVREVGTYNLWMSTWKTEPPPSTIIFSETQPFVIGSTRSFPIARKWQIPSTYIDPADSVDKPMIPGEYIRDISVTAEGRNTGNVPLQVLFTIRDNCPEG